MKQATIFLTVGKYAKRSPRFANNERHIVTNLLALRFAHFEKALLADALAALRAAMGDSPPESLSYVVAGAKGRHLERSYFAQA